MSQNSNVKRSRGADEAHPVISDVCRMIWLALGPVGVVFAGATLWQKPPWTYSTIDLIFWGIVLTTLAARLLDIWASHGNTTDERPATMGDWWRYAAKLVLVACGIWLLGQSTQA